MTRRAIVLDLLQSRAGTWISADELVAAGSGWRYAARIYELRRAGYEIEERRDPEGRHVTGQYRLIGPVVQAPGQLGLFDEEEATCST